MKIFVVTILAGDEAESLAHRLVTEAGAEIYGREDVDGIQHPYQAVDECDAIVWLYAPGKAPLGRTDYNYLYGDTVFQRAIRLGRPLLYYSLPEEDDWSPPAPALLARVTRRRGVRALSELEQYLREDLNDLVSGRILPHKTMSPSIFISYSHDDQAFARRLTADLEKAGVKVWLDERQLQVGDSLIEAIRQGIDEADYFAAVLSPAAVNSSWVRKELDVAMNHEIDGRRVKVLPLLHKQCDLPGFLKGKLYANFVSDYERALTQVLQRLGIRETQSKAIYENPTDATIVLSKQDRHMLVAEPDNATAQSEAGKETLSLVPIIEAHRTSADNIAGIDYYAFRVSIRNDGDKTIRSFRLEVDIPNAYADPTHQGSMSENIRRVREDVIVYRHTQDQFPGFVLYPKDVSGLLLNTNYQMRFDQYQEASGSIKVSVYIDDDLLGRAEYSIRDHRNKDRMAQLGLSFTD